MAIVENVAVYVCVLKFSLQFKKKLSSSSILGCRKLITYFSFVNFIHD